MNSLYRNIEQDVFILPATGSKGYIFYSPLRDSSFTFSVDFIGDIIDYYERGIPPKKETIRDYLFSIDGQPKEEPAMMKEIDTEDRAVILLTQKCNLACRYCFAQDSRSTAVLPLNKLYAVIDHMFLSNNNKSKVFSFLGGGEPLICWDSIQKAIEYIKNKSHETNIPYRCGIVTNATLLTEEKIQWIAKNNVLISVSSDVLPDIQNEQRPFAFKKSHTFDNVDKAIKLLLKYNVSFKLRSTITRLNVNRMCEMVDFVHKNYPALKTLHLEPVTDSAEEYELFYSQYITNFFEAYQLGLDLGVQVTNSQSSSFFHLKRHFCQGELCVTPTGDIVSCHRHSSKDDEYYKACRYGVVNDKVEIDTHLLQNVITLRQKRTVDCDTCYAKWHCAGGCASQKMVFAQKQQDSYCNYVRTFLRDLLEIQINNSTN